EIPVAAPWHERSERDAYHRVIDQAVLGEQVGFSHFWTVEHHFLSEFSHCSAPEVLYGAVAARTKTIRIGHGVRLLPFPYNHPIRAAEMAALLDCVCDGRLEFGTGRSATRDELEGFGIDPQETRGMWEEALEVIVGAWTTDVFSWEGTHFRVPPRRVLPKPLQKPHPPLWMASTSPASHEIEGQKGRELGSYEYTRGLGALNLSDVTFELLDDMDAVIVGDPETCIRKVKRYREAGCDQLLCLMQPYKIPPGAVTRSIELFGQNV